MTDNTPILGFPYPTGSDRVMDGDNAIQALAEAVEELLAVATDWKPYVPAYDGFGSAPVLGNGTIEGRYSELGHTVTFYARVTGGSTTTWGSGGQRLGLPKPARAGSKPKIRTICVNGTKTWQGTMYPPNSTDTMMAMTVDQGAAAGVLSLVGNGEPGGATGSWVAGCTIEICGTYERA